MKRRRRSTAPSMERLEARQLLRGGPADWMRMRSSAADLGLAAVATAPPSTVLAGRVVDARGVGVAGATVVAVDDGGRVAAAARADLRGRFVLRGVDPADDSLVLVAEAFGPASARLAGTAVPLARLAAGASPTIALAAIDPTGSVDFRRVARGASIDVTTPALPGFALHVAAGSAIGPAGGAYRGRIAATPSIGPDGSLAVAVDGPGLGFRTPAKVTLPNTTGAAPGATFPLIVVGPRGRAAASGVLQVSADGRSLETVDGGLLGPGVVLAPRAAAVASRPVDASIIAAPDSTPSVPSPDSTSPATATAVSRVVETTAAASLAVAVGATLEASIVPGGFVGKDVTYTITPQPLPANMTFNLGTGELTFVPGPGQAGAYDFKVVASDGVRSIAQAVRVAVSQPRLAATVVSGRVVDEDGAPLADVPVDLGGVAARTDEKGWFSLVGVPADPGPIHVGGATVEALGRLALSAPVPDLLGHPLYDRVDNVFPDGLIVPKAVWSEAVASRAADADGTLSVTDPSLPGFEIRIADQDAARRLAESPVSISTVELPESLAAQHLAPGESGKMILVRTSGLAPDQPVWLTLPNIWGYAPGEVLSLMKFNPVTGGREPVAEVVVSKDGETVAATDVVTMGTVGAATNGAVGSPAGAGVLGAPTPMGVVSCLWISHLPVNPQSNEQCHGCEPQGGDVAGVGNGAADIGLAGVPSQARGDVMFASDIGMLTGAFYEDHQTASYYSVGADRGVILEYSSLQADPRPVVQYQFTPPPAGASGSITSITVTVNLAGVIQGAPVTYNTPGGLVEGNAYYVPMQVDATALTTGVYPYTMTVTEHFGSSSSIDVAAAGYVDVVNNSTGALGAGWSVGGLQKIDQAASGQVVVTQGRQGTQRFNPVYDDGQSYYQDLALATGATTSAVMTNDGAAGFAVPTVTSGVVAGTAAGDFNGDGKPDQVVATASTLGILLNDGAGGFTTGSTFSVPSGYVARAVAVGDFTGHGDGVLDVAMVCAPTSGAGGYVVVVYTGTGTGAFSGPATSSVGGGGTATDGSDSIAVGDFDGDGEDDLVFTTASGDLDVMLASSGGSMTLAASPSLAVGHEAIGVTTVDYDSDGILDLVVETSANVNGFGDAAFLNVFAGTGSGSGPFTTITTTPYMTTGHPTPGIVGLVAGNFRGAAAGLEVAVPVHGHDAVQPEFLAFVPLSPGGALGTQVLYPIGNNGNAASADKSGNIIAADLNGVQGRPSIAFTDGTGYVRVLSPNPDSNQFFPIQNIRVSSIGNDVGKLAAAPFAGTAASPAYRGPASMPTTLVQNVGGTWTRTYPDGTVVQYDSSGREVSETDRNGNATTYAYVPAGQPGAGSLKTITDPVGLKTTFAYDGSGKLSAITDPAGRATTITIDANGNLTKIVDPDAAAVQYGYSTPSNHRITTEVGPRGKTVTVTYNAFGQATGEVPPGGDPPATVTPSRSRGLVAAGGSGTLETSYGASVTDRNGNTTTIGFSWMGHPNASEDAAGGSTSTAYDRRGFPVAATDALGRTTTYAYDVDGNVTSVTKPGTSGGFGSGPTMTIAYGPYGIPAAVTDFLGLTTTYALDSHGNVLRRTDPDGLYEEWTYDSHGQVLTDVDRMGLVTSYHYDQYGRLDQITNPSGSLSHALDLAVGGVAATNGGDQNAAFDGDRSTKWVGSVPNPYGTAYLRYQFPGGAAYAVTQYTLTSAADVSLDPGTAPKDWLLKGSNDGVNWTVLDSRTNQADTADSHATTYLVASPGSYKYYLLDVTANNGDPSATQLADLALQIVVTTPSVAASSVSLGYDAAGDLTDYTDELGHVWTYSYDAMGRLASAQDPVQAAAGKATTYDYDASGNLTRIVDALGRVTTYAYDDRDRLVSMTDPVHQGTGLATTYAHDGVNLTSTTDPLGHATGFGYDAVNRPTTVTDALNHVWTTAYDAAGQVFTQTDPDGRLTTFLYDASGRLATVTRPVDAGPGQYTVVGYTYDDDDRVVAVEGSIAGGVGTLRYAYDALGRLTSSSVSNQGSKETTYYAYDPDGRVVLTIDPNGFATRYSYDVRGRLVSQTAPPGGGTTSYAYDAASRLTSLTDPVGNVTSWTHDDAGRVATETDPLGKTTTYAYDLVGNPAQTTDRMGRVVQYSYDDDDRLAAATWLPAGGGAAVDSIAYDYDDAGRLVRVRDGASEYAYAYDAADRLVSVDDQGTTGLPQVTLTYDYDGAGDRTSLADSLGGQTSYDYDVRGRLTRIVQSGTGVADKRVDLAYDGDDRVVKLDRYSDQAGTAEVVATSYFYDQASRATRIEHQVPNSGSGSGGSGSGSGGYGSGSGSGVGGPLASYAYAYDPGGRTTGEDRTWDSGASSDSSTYEYTDDGQLLAVLRGGGGSGSGGYGSGSGGYGSGSGSGSGPGGPTVAEAFGYDANGNRNTAGYSTGTGNRLASDGVYSYAYDDEGELVSRTETATGDRTLYKWDVRGRLVEVDSEVGGATTVLAVYVYDALDRRIGVAEGGATVWTLYDGYSPVLDFDGSGTRKARYLAAGPDVVDAVLARETASGVAWYLPDRLGTIRDVVDNTGALIDHVDYNVFGGVRSETAPAAGDRLVGFAGMERSAATKLNLAVRRVQDPATGRWISPDPIGFRAGDPNLDRYVGNAPTNATDPTGEWAWVPIGAAVGAVAGGAAAWWEGCGWGQIALGAGIGAGYGAVVAGAFTIQSPMLITGAISGGIGMGAGSFGLVPGGWKGGTVSGTLGGLAGGWVAGTAEAGAALVGMSAIGGGISGVVNNGSGQLIAAVTQGTPFDWSSLVLSTAVCAVGGGIGGGVGENNPTFTAIGVGVIGAVVETGLGLIKTVVNLI